MLVVCFRGQFQGRHRRFLTDLLGNDLIDRRGVLLAVQPRARVPRVHARAVVVLKVTDRRHIFLEGLQRRRDLVQLEVRALSFRCPQIALSPELGVMARTSVDVYTEQMYGMASPSLYIWMQLAGDFQTFASTPIPACGSTDVYRTRSLAVRTPSAFCQDYFVRLMLEENCRRGSGSELRCAVV